MPSADRIEEPDHALCPKVLVLLPRIEPSANDVLVGGTVNALLNLLPAITRSSSITLLTAATSQHVNKVRSLLPTDIAVSIVRIDAVPQTSRYGLEFLFKTAWWAIVNRRHRFEIVHGHSGYAAYAWVTVILARIFGAKSVHTVYCPIARHATVYNKKNMSLSHSVCVVALKQIDQVLAMSENVAKSLVDAGLSAKPTAVLPIAINTDKYFPKKKDEQLCKRLNLEADAKLVAFVGSLSNSKGLDILLVALSKVVERFPNVRLVFTLEHDHKHLSERAKLINDLVETHRLEPYVKRLGFIDYMPDLLAAAEVAVSPYRDTQGPSDYPLALMEAMACGCCVVGTTVGGIPELITTGQNGQLVCPDSPNALAQALLELLASPQDVRRMGEQAAKFIRERYAPNQASDAHLACYTQLLGQRVNRYAT